MAAKDRPIKIIIEKTKCRFSLFDPLGCKKCIEICPVVVFGSVPKDRKPGGAPTIYELTLPWEDQCNECGACVQVCPTKAITLGRYSADEKPPWVP